MIAVLRSALRLVSLATALMALWLASVVLTVLPSRDPGHVQLWAIVAAGSAALAGISLVATRAAGTAGRLATLMLGLLGALSVGALAFGLLVLVTFSTSIASGGETEGYLMIVGAILATHGGLGLAWTATVLLRSLPWSARSDPSR